MAWLGPLGLALACSAASAQVTTLGSLNGTRWKYWHGVATDNGTVYGIPNGADRVLKIDTANDTITYVGSVGHAADKWRHGVVGRNGAIYGMPSNADSVLKIDPSTDSVTTFGSVGSERQKWSHGIAAGNGCIYALPHAARSVLRIEPGSDAVSQIGDFGDDTWKWMYGLTVSNGVIYGIPCYAEAVLKIDPRYELVTTFGSLGGGSKKWWHGVLAPNGAIYGIPLHARSVLKIIPFYDRAETFGNVGGGGYKWQHGVITTSGVIYGIPAYATSVLRIDTSTDTISTFGQFQGNSYKWWHGVLPRNGVVYGIPSYSPSLLRIDPADDSAKLEGHFGGLSYKWRHAVIASNGEVYGIPADATTVFKLVPEATTTMTRTTTTMTATPRTVQVAVEKMVTVESGSDGTAIAAAFLGGLLAIATCVGIGAWLLGPCNPAGHGGSKTIVMPAPMPQSSRRIPAPVLAAPPAPGASPNAKKKHPLAIASNQAIQRGAGRPHGREKRLPDSSTEASLAGIPTPSAEVAKSLDNPFETVKRQGAHPTPPVHVYPALPSSTAKAGPGPRPSSSHGQALPYPDMPFFAPPRLPASPAGGATLPDTDSHDDGSSVTTSATSGNSDDPNPTSQTDALAPPAVTYPDLPRGAPPSEEVTNYLAPDPKRAVSRQPPATSLLPPPLGPPGAPPATPPPGSTGHSISTTPAGTRPHSPHGSQATPFAGATATDAAGFPSNVVAQASFESSIPEADPAESTELRMRRPGTGVRLEPLTGLPNRIPHGEPAPRPPLTPLPPH
uniref:DUF6923 domain-containing protein n=1 Tax=Alexandrium monilatum TaxID=311494 RepID=A0A7S4S1W2_9DINO